MIYGTLPATSTNGGGCLLYLFVDNPIFCLLKQLPNVVFGRASVSTKFPHVIGSRHLHQGASAYALRVWVMDIRSPHGGSRYSFFSWK